MLTDPRIQAFKTLCQSSSSEELTVQEARTILLHVSKGMIPADKLLHKDGNLYTLPEVCSKTLGDLRKYSLFLGRRQLARDDVVEAMKQGEAISEKVCYLAHDFVYRSTLPETRLEAMAKGATVGIHFFTWDGKPRDAADIHKAMCKYSTQKKVMSKVTKGLLYASATVAIVALAYYKRGDIKAGLNKITEMLKSAGVPEAEAWVKSHYAKARAWVGQGLSESSILQKFRKAKTEEAKTKTPRKSAPRDDDDARLVAMGSASDAWPPPFTPRPRRDEEEEEEGSDFPFASYYKTPRRVRLR